MDRAKDFINQSKLGKEIEKKVGSELLELLGEYKKFIQGETGRPKEYNLEEVTQVFKRVEAGEITPTEGRKQLEISKTHYYFLLKNYNKK